MFLFVCRLQHALALPSLRRKYLQCRPMGSTLGGRSLRNRGAQPFGSTAQLVEHALRKRTVVGWIPHWGGLIL